MKRAVFLDKDGTLIEDVPYNVDPGKIRLMPGTPEALRAMRHAGYELVIITNQSGVARGYFEEQALVGVEERLREMFGAVGVPLAGFYYCPHHPEGSVARYAVRCWCRKPAPGLLYRASIDQKIHLESSWFLGDILNDIEAGRRAGCRTILLDSGGETEWQLSANRHPHYIVEDLAGAARVIRGTGADAAVTPAVLRELAARGREAQHGNTIDPAPGLAMPSAGRTGERL